jgi:mannose/fructose/N-acetylgalactosamine-specific phosphotransferase system component IIC
MEPGLLVALSVFGGLAALDATTVGQVMISRPLVACTLAGWIAGSPAGGAMFGVVLEALHIAVLPVGAARYPESAPASTAAAAAFVLGKAGGAELLVATLFALAWEQVGAWTVHRLRVFNVRFAVAEGAGEVDPATVERRHLAAIALDFARGALLTLAAILLLRAVLDRAPAAFPHAWAQVAVGLAGTAGLASALRLFGRSRMALFAAGAAAGLLVLLVR